MIISSKLLSSVHGRNNWLFFWAFSIWIIPYVIIYKSFVRIHWLDQEYFNPLNANFTKGSNTLKQFVGKLPTNCLSVFDHFVGLAVKGLRFVDKVVLNWTFNIKAYVIKSSQGVCYKESPLSRYRDNCPPRKIGPRLGLGFG